MKLIVRTKWKSGGYGDQSDQTTILDLGVCALEAAAASPSAGGGYYGGAGGRSHGGYGGVSGDTGGVFRDVRDLGPRLLACTGAS
ncbi:hypothetical protein [Dactylosporangium sp. NPDC049140]|uniref:hypothetical protein n=1 Tax=Dactylosporangium sp. NPDC049140 TaxID=3155647 RepID=UPI0033FFCF15